MYRYYIYIYITMYSHMCVFSPGALLPAQVPASFNLEDVMKAKADDPSAQHVVLFQEIERYNQLLAAVRKSCIELQKGIKGLVVMSADLDQIFDALYNAKVGLGG